MDEGRDRGRGWGRCTASSRARTGSRAAARRRARPPGTVCIRQSRWSSGTSPAKTSPSRMVSDAEHDGELVRCHVDQPGAERRRRARPRITKTTVKPSTNSTEPSSIRPRRSARRWRGRRRRARWRRRGSPAAAGSRTARRTTPARRSAPPGARAAASRRPPALEPLTHRRRSRRDVLDEVDQRGRRRQLARGCWRRPGPRASRTTKLGIEFGGQRPAEREQRLAVRRVERRVGDARTRRSNAERLVGRGVADVDADELRRVVELARAPSTTSGASARHGAHHEPQTTTTTGLPRRSARSSGLAVEVLAGRASTASPRSAGGDLGRRCRRRLTKPLSPVPCRPRAARQREQTGSRRAAHRASAGARARSGPLLLGRAAGRERRVLVAVTGIRSPAGSE